MKSCAKLLACYLICSIIFGCESPDLLNAQNEQETVNSANLAARNASALNASAEPVIRYRFDQEIGNWFENTTCCPWSVTLNNSIKRAGAGSLKVELKIGDIPNNHRAELGQAPNSNQEAWYGFSVYFPASFQKESIEESIVQWNSLPDLQEGESWRSSPLFLGVLDDRYLLEIRSDAERVTKHFSFERLDLGQVEKDSWHDWVFHVKWAYDNTGSIEVWKDGKMVLNRPNKPNSYNDALYPYFKLGIYKWDWSYKSTPGIDNRTMYFDEVSIGNQYASYKMVSPATIADALPVTLVSFSVATQGTTSRLKWSTTQEVNADRFIIQRSTNAKDWKNLGETAATGASAALTTYRFIDQKPFKGTSYYRLKMIDKDETFTYSSIKSLKF